MMENRHSCYTSRQEIAAMQEELLNAKAQSLAKQDTYTRKKIWKLVSRITGVVMICLLCKVWIDIEVAKANGEVPTVFGFQVYEVKTGSMDPTLPVSSLILSKTVASDQVLQKGDIITFEQNGTIITHRIIEVHQDQGSISYTTKGDNAQNSVDPDPVYANQVKARFMMKLPFYLSESDGETHE